MKKLANLLDIEIRDLNLQLPSGWRLRKVGLTVDLEFKLADMWIGLFHDIRRPIGQTIVANIWLTLIPTLPIHFKLVWLCSKPAPAP